jgi:branched-chain amino acid transport system substrate-binding protein
MKQKRRLLIALPLLALLLFVTGCTTSPNTAITNVPKEILIGASISKSGALSTFGLYTEWSYSTVIDDINNAGGLYLSQYHTKVPMRLVTYDDKSDGNVAAANIQRLITQDKVAALLGSATPPVVIPGALVAEKMKIPMVTGLTPIRSFLGGAPKWNYVWDTFFDELSMTQVQFQAMNTQNSNHKVAIFADDEQDGVVMGGLWEQNAVKYGYNVVLHAKFPVGNTDYTNFITQAKADDAQIVIAQMDLPDAIRMWQQFQAQQYHPKAAFLEKAAETTEWTSVLHATGQGIMLEGFWYPSLPYPGAAQLRQRFELDTSLTYTAHIANTFTVAQVVIDAITRAGNLDPQAINTAIQATNKTYVQGPVNFATGPGGHTSVIPNFVLQWQNGQTQIVYPAKLATAKMIYPLP